MNFRIVGQFLGHIALAETCVLAIPLVSSLIHRDGATSAFVFSMVICFGISTLFFSSGESKKEKLTIQESIAITGCGWLLATAMRRFHNRNAGRRRFLGGRS